MSMHMKHKEVTNHNTKAKGTSMVARLCTTKVASRALRNGEQRFLYNALLTNPRTATNQLGEDNFKKIIEQFNDMLTGELPNVLPPQREFDHKIQIGLGSIPPAKVPHHMIVASIRRTQNSTARDGCVWVYPTKQLILWCTRCRGVARPKA